MILIAQTDYEMKNKTETTEKEYFLNQDELQMMIDLIEFRFEMATIDADNFPDRLAMEDLYVYLKRMQIESTKS